MNAKQTRTLALGIALLLCAALLLLAQSGDEIFRQARQKEVVDGDIPAAIQLYERVVRDFPANRALVAQALFQIGECYERLGQPGASRPYFERLSEQFKDQTEWSARAKARLAAMAPNRIEIQTPYSDNPFAFAISPDGRNLVFQATVDGKTQLFLREIDTNKTTPLAGTGTSWFGSQDRGPTPFWSPDGRAIGFFADQKLKRIDIETGKVQTLADAPDNRGGTWSQDDVILFAAWRGPIYRVSANSGEPVAVTVNDSGSDRYPQFLLDGRHFLLFDSGTLMYGSLDSRERRRPEITAQGARFIPPDNLIFAERGVLIAQRLDLQSLTLIGTATRLADSVSAGSFRGVGTGGSIALSVSTTGRIAFRAETPALEGRYLTWYDRLGKRSGTLGAPERTSRCCMRFSFNSATLMYSQFSGGVQMIDAATGAPLVQFGGYYPIWSADASRVAFGSSYGQMNILQRPIDGVAAPVFSSQDEKVPNDWSRNGFLLYERLARNATTANDLLAILMDGTSGPRQPVVVAGTSADERNGRFSPDGNWITYELNEGNGSEIVVQPFPGSPVSRRQISVNGGTNPQWRSNSRELFFLSPDNRLMTVSVEPSPVGLNFGKPAPLFQMPPGSEYAVSPNGERFLVSTREAAPPIVVMTLEERREK